MPTKIAYGCSMQHGLFVDLRVPDVLFDNHEIVETLFVWNKQTKHSLNVPVGRQFLKQCKEPFVCRMPVYTRCSQQTLDVPTSSDCLKTNAHVTNNVQNLLLASDKDILLPSLPTPALLLLQLSLLLCPKLIIVLHNNSFPHTYN